MIKAPLVNSMRAAIPTGDVNNSYSHFNAFCSINEMTRFTSGKIFWRLKFGQMDVESELILVVRYQQESIIVDLPPAANLFDLKQVLQQRTGIPPPSQKLIGFAIDELDDLVSHLRFLLMPSFPFLLPIMREWICCWRT